MGGLGIQREVWPSVPKLACMYRWEVAHLLWGLL
jgi:hypothetical protein